MKVTEGDIRSASGLEYWRLRYARHGERVPGSSNNRHQDKEYEKKIGFVHRHIDTRYRTLDYGCGIGWYSVLFDDYLGFDPIGTAIEIAKERNPEKRFTTSKTDALLFAPELVLFATVLQHIEKPDEVLEPFKNAKKIVLFENVAREADKNYIWFRDVAYYENLLNRKVKTIMYDHVYRNRHGQKCTEPHALIIG